MGLRTFWLRVLLLCVAGQAFLGMRSYGEDQAALADRLQRATELTSLDATNLQPWYLKIEVQMFDDKGQPSGQGTVEEWWASPTLHRVVYTSGSNSRTELQNAYGYYRTSDSASGTDDVVGGYPMKMMLQQVVHPMPSEDEFKSAKFQEQTDSFGKVKLDCVMVGEDIRGVAYFPYGLFPMYCMDHGEASLRLSYNFGSLVVARNRMGKFLEKSVPVETTA